MSSDPKNAASPVSSGSARRDKGVRIFTYPKFIFLFPTMVMSIVCWIGMVINNDRVIRPSQGHETVVKAPATNEKPVNPVMVSDFRSPQNMLALLFLGVFALNLLIVTFDFPRFTIVAGVLLATTVTFLLLWLGMAVFAPLIRILDGMYLAANAGFYFVLVLIFMLLYAAIFASRWLDYWEFMPNEILHHHGPWSDLERFPTMQLKFDKEIPDVFEHMLFGAGRLVFHVQGEQKSIILDNVLHINRKEEALKQIMSRLEVRVTTDQEVAQP